MCWKFSPYILTPYLKRKERPIFYLEQLLPLNLLSGLGFAGDHTSTQDTADKDLWKTFNVILVNLQLLRNPIYLLSFGYLQLIRLALFQNDLTCITSPNLTNRLLCLKWFMLYFRKIFIHIMLARIALYVAGGMFSRLHQWGVISIRHINWKLLQILLISCRTCNN